MMAVALIFMVQASRPSSLLVVPAESRTPDTAWIDDAFSDFLPRDLTLLGVDAIEQEDRRRAHVALGIPATALSRATSIRIGEILGASRLAITTHALDGDQLTLSLRLLDIERGTLSAPLRASGPLSSLPELIHRLAWDVALAGPSRPTLTLEALLKRRPPLPFEAFRAYGQALAAREPVSRSRLLKSAVTLAPGFDEARIALGRHHLEAREQGAAIENLSRVPNGSPFARTARLLQGVALFDAAHFRDATALFAALAADDPTPAVLNNHALALLRSGAGVQRGGRASDVLRKAVELAPGAPDLLFNLGWVMLIEGEPERAAFWLRGIRHDQAADAHAKLALSWALRLSGRTGEAEEEWKGLIAMAPAYSGLEIPDLNRRMERVLQSERLLVLDEDARSAVELAALHLLRAEKLEQAGDRDGARRELTRAVLLDPYSARAHLRLARTHRGFGEKEQAVNELRAAAWCEEDPVVRLELAGLLKELGRLTEAKAEAERVLKNDPANTSARRFLDAR